MKNKRLLIIMGFIALLFSFFSCKKESRTPAVGFQMTATDTGMNPGMTKSTLDTTTLPITWDTATIILNKLQFEAEFKEHTDSSSLSMEVEYKWQGNQTVDLLAEPQIFATIDLPDGTYKEIELKVTSGKSDNPGTPNFYLSGTLAVDTNALPVVLVVTDDFTLRMEVNDWEINNETGSVYDGLIELSLQQLFSHISLSDLTGAEITDGRVVISSSVNSDLYEKIIENLGSSGNCHHDGDGGHGHHHHHGEGDDEGDGD